MRSHVYYYYYEYCIHNKLVRNASSTTCHTANRPTISRLAFAVSVDGRALHPQKRVYIYICIYCLCPVPSETNADYKNVQCKNLAYREEREKKKQKKNIPIKYVWNILHICVYKLEWRTSWNERCGRHSHGWSRMRKRDELSSFSNPCAPIQLHSESSSVPTAAAALLLMERIFDFFYLMRWRSFSHFLSLTRLLARLLACSYSLLLCCCFCFVSSLEQPYTILAL